MSSCTYHMIQKKYEEENNSHQLTNKDTNAGAKKK
jgi:hypothetical protein